MCLTFIAYNSPNLSMDFQGFVVSYLVFSCFAASCYGVTLSSLQKTLKVTVSSPIGHFLKAGEDGITIKWEYNQTFPAGTDTNYKTVKLKLCYGWPSQIDRPWRKTVDNLKKDKTCQHMIAARPYIPSNNSVVWTIEREVPSANFFVRAYVFDGQGVEVGYGQNTDASKHSDLFTIQAITGRHASIDAASVCFSVFSLFSLAVFFYIEKGKATPSQQR
uniref:high-affinity nitrate transporter 3.1-like n=1 Tax=Erigeron canadensis TaxID=72917 RepID=UPI001CB96D9B|nr:high-affinity nitrate transporter 3.1-like [Erigeron canadensis]